MRNFLAPLLPFLFIGIIIVLLVVGFILLSYLLIAGAIIGFILFLATKIRIFFSKKNNAITKKRVGITIEQNDFKK